MCCADTEHCCPRGYKCSLDGKSCSFASQSIAALSTGVPKTISKSLRRFLQQIVKAVSNELLLSATGHRKQSMVFKEKVMESIVCPDGKSECPADNSCCKLSSGSWGCCPLRKAVCCSDGVHCCPQGYHCDVANGTCSRDRESLPLFQKRPATSKNVKVSYVVCPDEISECPNKSTCCKLHSGDWGCCPFPKAVCCSDGEHCCPEGHTCDIPHQTCKKTGKMFLMVNKAPALRKTTKPNNVICPDKESQCQEDQTCCKLASGEYGCCPLPHAVCCSDKLHCCPEGYRCDLSAQTCTTGIGNLPLFRKVKSSSQDDNGRSREPMLLKTSASRLVRNNIVCPGEKVVCQESQTCCEISAGEYGCCPVPDAVCCSDGEHCCPHGYICNISAARCTQESRNVPFLRKIKAFKRVSKKKSIICPDGESECPDGNTCCKLSSGAYGSCPLPNAVCCSDGIHCCPSGYTCDVANGTCAQGSKILKILQKIPALKSAALNRKTGEKLVQRVAIPSRLSSVPKENNVICPDESRCPDDNTCCELSSGRYGCCPLPNAVCCSDGIHCCPSGYMCDVANGTCDQGSKILKILQKIPALKSAVVNRKTEEELVQRVAIPSRLSSVPKENNVICPDGSRCPDDNTCCELSSGGYGCCPLPNAVCCSDGIYCCPSGYTCDVANGTCDQGSKILKIMQKIPALKSAAVNRKTQEELVQRVAIPSRLSSVPKENNVICPDGSQCPDDNTCCELSSGGYGCCPLPNAVCCSDGIHCCPSGYTCDVANGTCDQGSKILKIMQKIPALKSAAVNRKTQEELVQRVAIPSRLSSVPKENNVICPDGSQCPDDNTCCKLSSGGYGCCPLPNAVCCSDGIHCCPSGYTCDVANGTCDQGSKILKIMQKIPALTSAAVNRKTQEELVQRVAIPSRLSSVPKENNVICPDESRCPDDNTCCELSSGGYGCCSLPNAVCCSDGIHCCPSGYTCDVANGTCDQGSKILKILQKIPALKSAAVNRKTEEELVQRVAIPSRLSSVPKENNVICPDGSQCPDDNTCCELSSGGYGCCPLPNAVCCSDGIHWCPSGYVCNLSAGTCDQGRGKEVGVVLNVPAVLIKTKKGMLTIYCPW